MSPLIRTVRDLRATVHGAVALVLVLAAGAALMVLAVKCAVGDPPNDLAQWGLILGAFIQGATTLLTNPSRHDGRVTDPAAPARVSTTTTVEPDPEAA